VVSNICSPDFWTQSSFLDISQVPQSFNGPTESLWEQIFDDEDAALPYTVDLPYLKDWKPLVKLLTARIEAGCNAITHHTSDSKLSRLRLEGPLGVFGMLRALEFLRRLTMIDGMESKLGVYFHVLCANVSRLFAEMELTCRREMWCRWASGSLKEANLPASESFIRRWQLYVETFRKQLPHSSNDDVSNTLCFLNIQSYINYLHISGMEAHGRSRLPLMLSQLLWKRLAYPHGTAVLMAR
jgi:hypothetical protein